MSSLLAPSMLITNIGELVSAPPGRGPIRGEAMSNVQRIADACIAVDDAGLITWVGSRTDVASACNVSQALHVDAGGALVVPGLVDCHAHPVFGGDRATEFELRNLGASYEAIHAAGGGIRSTVERTRSAIDDGSIDDRIADHLSWMLQSGTTTAEAKSGYALTHDGELASLEAAHRVALRSGIRIAGTALAAHTIPAEYEGRPDDYLDEVAIPAIEASAERGLATAADVFLERGSFTQAQATRYLTAASHAGLHTRLHGDQFSDAGAVQCALEVGARSIDHLEAMTAVDGRLRDLAASDVAAVLLPLSSLFLRRPYAPGRALVDAGGIVALASDFNPGSSYGESLPLAMSLASIGCGLRATEALVACTANAAWVLDLEHVAGRIAPGMPCDLALFDQPSLEHLAYHVGSPQLTGVFVAGTRVA